MTEVKLWYYIQDKPDVSHVTISPNETIAHLKQKIHNECRNTFMRLGYDAWELILRKVDEDYKCIRDQVNAGQYRPDLNDESLFEGDTIANVWSERPPDKHLHVYVSLPGGMRSPTQYGDMIIRVDDWGNLEHSDLGRNNIVRICDTQDVVDTQDKVTRMTVPHVVTNFEQKLERKPRLQSTHTAYIDMSKSYFDLPSVDPTTEDESHEETRYAELSEVLHTAHHVAYYEWEKYWQGTRAGTRALKEHAAKSIFFDPLIYTPKKEKTVTVLQDQYWPFLLVVVLEDDRLVDGLRKYHPRSDLLISHSTLPRLLVELNNSTSVNSWPVDLIRMLLMGASVVRFANKFVSAFRKERNFVLGAIFIWDDGNATRYTIFQQQKDEMVYYKEKQLSLNVPDGRVELARLLYNLLCGVEVDEAQDRDTKNAIREMMRTVSRLKLDTLYTEVMADRDGADGGGSYRELRARGYEVEPETFVDSSGGLWAPLFKVPDHILTVYRPLNENKKFIAKRVRKGSNELEILRFLDTIPLKSDHVISLIDSFHRWAILHRMVPIKNYFCFNRDKLESKVSQVCSGLIEGLAYLHEHCIAHRDIKPSNFLVDKNFCLKIIDFDIAMRVEDEDEEVDDQCGTENWMAPEVKKKLTHSPIKADRWACGRVLLFLLDEFKKEDKYLRAFARSLMAYDPKQRRQLLEWRSYPTASLLDDGNEWNVDARKASRRPQDQVEADEEDTMSPKAKKQRLDG